MTRNRILGLFVGVSLMCVMPMRAQESRPAGERPSPSGRDTEAGPTSFAVNDTISREAQAAAPRVLKFSGVLLDASGKPLSGEVEVTFALYKQEGDEEALWTETQRVIADERGGYAALLGVTQATGIPAEVFRSDEARWLGVQVQGAAQQPRTLLVSVPYALKAVEAEKLAGKSASDFVLSESLGDQVRRVIEGQSIVASQATSTGAAQPGQTKANSTSTTPTTTAGPMFPPSTFSGTNAAQIVQVQQNGSGNGLFAQTASSTGNSGVVGAATSTSTSNNQNGVIGFNAGAGSGVAGIATNPSAGVGVYGQSANFAGVFGNSFVTSGFATGVFGIGTSPDGAGVFGGNNATSGFAPGVSANSASPNGVGVFGNALATSGFAAGVQGLTHSPGGTGVTGFGIATGVLGSASASSGFANGVFGQSFSPDGAGVGGFANATSGFAIGVSGGTVSSDGAGVFGNAIATSGSADGVLGQTANGGNGVRGLATATSGNASGVFGVTASPGGNGVFGAAVATSGSANGVLGMTSASTGIAVWGAYGFGPTSGFGVGVKGSIEAGAANGGVAGQFFNVPGKGLLLQGISGSQGQVFSVDANGNLQMSGNLTVNGTKSSTAKLQDGRTVALYAVESPENWFEDFGSAELRSGVARVPLDPSFAQAVNAEVNYHVFLTPNGDSNGLYVARKTATGFEVREHGGGGSNVAFDYRIVVKRRGYETLRMAEVREDTKIIELSKKLVRESTNAEILKSAAAVRIPPTGSKPAIRPATQRPNIQQEPKPIIPQVPKVNVAQPRQPK